ncbi:t [Anaeramoeba flamelloides]|uniref:T n=1 Tax=Anaeramoeba flamelloides TaxID=1746091 RepID=A0ABQ8X9G9_9EUKA|nr:t [Anaeramoeba flamelloides] [Anaeramoeba flamelloides]
MEDRKNYQEYLKILQESEDLSQTIQNFFLGSFKKDSLEYYEQQDLLMISNGIQERGCLTLISSIKKENVPVLALMFCFKGLLLDQVKYNNNISFCFFKTEDVERGSRFINTIVSDYYSPTIYVPLLFECLQSGVSNQNIYNNNKENEILKQLQNLSLGQSTGNIEKENQIEKLNFNFSLDLTKIINENTNTNSNLKNKDEDLEKKKKDEEIEKKKEIETENEKEKKKGIENTNLNFSLDLTKIINEVTNTNSNLKVEDEEKENKNITKTKTETENQIETEHSNSFIYFSSDLKLYPRVFNKYKRHFGFNCYETQFSEIKDVPITGIFVQKQIDFAIFKLGSADQYNEKKKEKMLLTLKQSLSELAKTKLDGSLWYKQDYTTVNFPIRQPKYKEILDLELLYELMIVPTASSQEFIMIDYLEHKLKKKGIQFQKDNMGNLFSLTKTNRPILAAHVDTVQKINDFGSMSLKIDEQYQILHNPGQVLGGDDKTGVYVILHLLLKDEADFNFIFTVQEEIGLHGSKAFVISNPDLLSKFNLCFVLDSFFSDRIEFKYMKNLSVQKKIWKIAKQFNFKNKYHFGSTDARNLQEKVENAIELSTGNYNLHKNNEFVHLPSLANTLLFMRSVLQKDW